MSKLQKFAVFNLSLSSVGLTIVLVMLLSSNPLLDAIASTLVLFLVGCPLMASYLFRQKFQKQGSQYYDERDKMIHKKAAFVGLFTIPLTLSFITLLVLITFGPLNSISINLLLNILLFSLMSLWFAESIAVLVQYNWWSDNG